MNSLSKSLYQLSFVFLLSKGCSQPQQKEQGTSREEINYREAIEFIAPKGTTVDSLIKANVSSELGVYSWKNHTVVFGEMEDVKRLEMQVSEVISNIKIKEYLEPLYVYDKSLHCSDSTLAVEWRDYLLTANLVEDSVKQQEYVAYHDTQFEEWPEIAQGFCNARFQQLLVYRSGRQLLLVISIPADKTLDELNPKTVENNPRVDDWNALMAQYQEGIPGTSESEVWVFLE
ncbi:L-rhamnose mutarotase [Marinoscillum sp. MHG1-6]|uniref:L-rhamnose mutarotase n=1 Tax=Marinoscillum sp. MHG1-6 TaxID=2959627 RepID=UPI002157E037|nr:L-rhamnose mutarotase [Marinoscillum sp. MHG1-6]